MARPARKGGKRSAAKKRKAGFARGRKPKTQAQKPQTADPQQLIAELRRELNQARGDLGARNTAYSERIAYQAAANDVLKMMSASPGDPQPVFDLISVRARDLCNAYGVTVYEFDGTLLHWRAATGVSDDPAVRAAAKAAYPSPPSRHLLPNRAILDRAVVHVRDHEADTELRRISHTVKSSVVVPFMRGNLPIGALHMGSRERGGFSDSQVGLLETFADQAVIAIENARLFNETQEGMERQTATADILKVIAASPTNVQPVFDTIATNALRLCNANWSGVLLYDGETIELAAVHNLSDPGDAEALRRAFPRKPGRTGVTDRAISRKETCYVPDVKVIPNYEYSTLVQFSRSVLSVPMLRLGQAVGAITVVAAAPNAFTERQKGLLRTFADQAVIAIENARLFNETQEAMERQAATSDILKVIASSPDNVQPVFDAIAQSAKRLFGAHTAVVTRVIGDMIHLAAFTSVDEAGNEALQRSFPFSLSTPDIHTRVVRNGALEFRADILNDPNVPLGAKTTARARGYRSILVVPMLREGNAIGTIVVTRPDPGLFSKNEMELLQTFANHAVIAIENARLFDEVQARTRELAQSLEDLRSAQDRLVQTEKLASLGQLTAGIAHEIKNPLNFINNFSALSAELVDEMTEVVESAQLDEKDKRKELEEIRELLKSNLEKVVQHGKRADSIVKNMLLHSREGSREQRSADVNALVEESLNLAYHGARAEKSGFEITLQRDLDANAGIAEVFPQEVSRALLNLISNGFYAATKRKTENGGAGVEPIVLATTKDLGNSVEIRIRDNGTGIPPDVREKMFNPFFTTKPTGEGTGLGLSMTHDIIVKQHGGTIDVETKLGEFTEFIITLPRGNGTADRSKPE